MITLQQLLMTDSDPSGGTLTGKGAEGAQDFLSLLAGALTETTGKGKDAPLTLADLKAAGNKLSTAAKEKNGDTTLQAKIAELLSRQETLTGEDTAVSLQSLVSGLKPAANTDALKTLTQPEAKTNSETTTEEEELAGLSAVMAITSNELDTARRRTTGSMDALKAAGFPEKQIYQVPTKSNDIPGAFDAANSMLVQHPEVKHWLIVGMNDSTVLGGVRATEGQGFKAADIIGIGINGVDAVSELSKAQATGFYGSLLPSPDVHGYKSSEMLYNWVAKGVEPTKFTEVTDVVLITRDNFKEELEKKGLGGK